MSTTEGNQLIANFIGILTDGDRTSKHFGSKLLQYHSSWDWLMPVVEKIEAIEDSDNYEVDIFGNCCQIGISENAIGETKIEATWNAVILFIQWYNQNK